MELLREEIRELRGEIRNLSLQRGPTDPSPTPSTLGGIAVEKVKEFNGYSEVSAEIFPGAPTDPFLNSEQMLALQNTNILNESVLVQFFQPHFRRLMKQTTKELGFEVVLINSERHAWVECPKGGASLKPDGVAVAVEFAAFDVSDGDKKYQNKGDNNFGSLASWVLRDCIEFISEWKVGKNFKPGLGEGIEYHRRIISSFRKDRHVQDSKLTTDVMVANELGFFLVRCYNGDARSIYASRWDSPCSKHALFLFATGKLWPGGRKRIWKDSLQQICRKLNVKLVTGPKSSIDCFLGYGSVGRVFLACRGGENQDGELLALKVAVGDVTNAKCEELQMKLYKDRLDRANVTTSLVSSTVMNANGCAGLLLRPVGRLIERRKKDMISAITSLRDLHLAGFAHCDSRWPNAVILDDGKCYWIDLRTLEDVVDAEDESRTDAFTRDVSMLAQSFGVSIEWEQLRPLASSYFHGGSDLDRKALLKELAMIWDG